MIVRRSATGELTVSGENLGILPPIFEDGVPHWGVVGRDVYASCRWAMARGSRC